MPDSEAARSRVRRALDGSAASLIVVAVISIATIVPSIMGAPGVGVLLAMLIVGAVLRLRRTGLREIGFRSPASWHRTLAAGLLLGALIHLASLLLFDPVIETVTGTPIDLSPFDGIRGNFGALLMWLAIVWILVVFVEEIIFRGFLMIELRKLLGDSRSMLFANLVLTSVLFGLAHWYQGPSGVLSTGLIGLLLGLVFISNGFGLWLPILVHGFIDTVGLAMIYLNADRWLMQLL